MVTVGTDQLVGMLSVGWIFRYTRHIYEQSALVTVNLDGKGSSISWSAGSSRDRHASPFLDIAELMGFIRLLDDFDVVKVFGVEDCRDRHV